MCSFCDTYNYLKKFDKDRPLTKGRTKHYKVQLHTYITENGHRSGSATYQPGPLNFCPECGKPLKKKGG